METTKKRFISSFSPEGQFLDTEMDLFRSIHKNNGNFSTVLLTSPTGIHRVVTTRFALWFTERNQDWSYREN
jgi:hypothetical protein